MRICEHSFVREDPDLPGYSLHEVDYYAWIPQNRGHVLPNHRLSLRRNLVTMEWEFYRAYHRGTTVQQIKAGRDVAIMVIHLSGDIVETAFKTKDFKAALDYGNAEWNRMHKTDDYEREPDMPCSHGGAYGTYTTLCAARKKRNHCT